MPGSPALQVHQQRRPRERAPESTPEALWRAVENSRANHADIGAATGLTKEVVRAVTRGNRPNFDATEVLLEYFRLDEAALVKELEEVLAHQFTLVPVRVRRRILDRALLSVRNYLETGVMPGENATGRTDRRSTVSKPARGKAGPARISAASGSNSVGRVQPPPTWLTVLHGDLRATA